MKDEKVFKDIEVWKSTENLNQEAVRAQYA